MDSYMPLSRKVDAQCLNTICLIIFLLFNFLILRCENENFALLDEHPWPMYQHDAQHTGKSPYVGPKYGKIKWKINIGALFSTPVIDKKGVIYLGSMQGGFYAINPDGSIKWYFPTSKGIFSTPAIDKNGNIYFGCEDKYFYSLDNNGCLNWKYLTTMRIIRISPIIDDRGTIYLLADSAYAFNSEGMKKWTLPLEKNLETKHRAVPTIDNLGNIYMSLDKFFLYIISPQGIIINRIDYDCLTIGSPVIDRFNNIYCISPSKICFSGFQYQGKLKWSIQLFNIGIYQFGSSSPALSKYENTVYMPSDAYLLAFDVADGTLKWDWFTRDLYSPISNSPITDYNGDIYVGGGYYLLIISPEGELKNSIKLEHFTISSPVLGYDRVLYITAIDIDTNQGFLYAIE